MQSKGDHLGVVVGTSSGGARSRSAVISAASHSPSSIGSASPSSVSASPSLRSGSPSPGYYFSPASSSASPQNLLSVGAGSGGGGGGASPRASGGGGGGLLLRANGRTIRRVAVLLSIGGLMAVIALWLFYPTRGGGGGGEGMRGGGPVAVGALKGQLGDEEGSCTLPPEEGEGEEGGRAPTTLSPQEAAAAAHKAKYIRWVEAELNKAPDPIDGLSSILPVPKMRPFGMLFIAGKEEDICTSVGLLGGGDALEQQQQQNNFPQQQLAMTAVGGSRQQSAAQFALPMQCPLRGSSPAAAFAFADDAVNAPAIQNVLLWDGTLRFTSNATAERYNNKQRQQAAKTRRKMGESGLRSNSNDSEECSSAKAALSSWRVDPLNLSKKNRGRIALKALKYLLSATGCDSLLEVSKVGMPVSREQEEMRMLSATEHGRDMSILVLGGVFGESSSTSSSSSSSSFYHVETNFIVDLLTIPMSKEHAVPPRLNLLTLVDPTTSPCEDDEREAEVAAYEERCGGGGDTQSSGGLMAIDKGMQKRLAAGRHQPSSAVLCPMLAGSGSVSSSSASSSSAAGVLASLAAIPSNTFTSVMAFDYLRRVKLGPNELKIKGPANNPMCAVVTELLRVTKVGGAVWAGHIEDPLQIEALSKCRVATLSCVAPLPPGNSSSSSSDGSSSSRSRRHQRFTISMVSLKEAYWYKYFLNHKDTGALIPPSSSADGSFPMAPLSFVWRKVPLEEEEEEAQQRALKGGAKKLAKGMQLPGL